MIGGTTGEEAESIRALLDSTYLVNSNGGVVNSSRAVLLAYKKAGAPEENFAEEARKEVLRMRKEIEDACEAMRISRGSGK